ncbi:hypothetical protein [Taibaiella helva]|uniref:hypothetical protein n=1 Tax=Taibaiella helva TaxID=2301235 RepID=UPI000E59036F|nr:hypothetical protein [Taibaiella helva]
MSKRFILSTSIENKDVTLKLIDFFKSNNYGWAHHFDNTWLLTTISNKDNPDSLRLKLRDILAGYEFIIVEIADFTWVARARTNGDFNNWLKDKFKSSEEKKIKY